MPDLMPYVAGWLDDVHPFYQVVTAWPAEDVSTRDTITLGHSPASPQKQAMKGTPQIKRAFKKVVRTFPNARAEIIVGLSHKQCLEKKREMSIFVDQVVSPDLPGVPGGARMGYTGGLGKSGLEAMMVGCSVLTSGIVDCQGEFENPPVISVSAETLLSRLVSLVKSPDALRSNAENCLKWARKHLVPEAWVKRYIPEN